MQKLSKKETLLREKDEAERAEAYAKKQRRQYRRRFGALTPYIMQLLRYIALALMILAVIRVTFFVTKSYCVKCYPCSLPAT